MAIKQTRKSVSLNALEHALAMEAAETAGVSLSRFTEQALRELGARRPSPDQFLAAEQSIAANSEAGTSSPSTLRSLIDEQAALIPPRDHHDALQESELIWRCACGAESPGNRVCAACRTVGTLISRSSIGRGLANIEANGVDAELADLDKELAEVTPEQMTAVLGPPPEADNDDGVRVEYDE